jgi:hypothetical protein
VTSGLEAVTIPVLLSNCGLGKFPQGFLELVAMIAGEG